MDWIPLTESNQLEDIIQSSYKQAVIIYKHSTRCGISAAAKEQLELHWPTEFNHYQLYYLDLLSYKSVSNDIAEKFRIEHQSPQALLIKNGECVYSANHYAINAADLLNEFETL